VTSVFCENLVEFEWINQFLSHIFMLLAFHFAGLFRSQSCLSCSLSSILLTRFLFLPSVSPSRPKDFSPCLHFPVRQQNLSLGFSFANLSAIARRKFLFSHSLISPLVKALVTRPNFCFPLCHLRQVQSNRLAFILPTQESSSFSS
jgi:hypothetical protein